MPDGEVVRTVGRWIDRTPAAPAAAEPIATRPVSRSCSTSAWSSASGSGPSSPDDPSGLVGDYVGLVLIVLPLLVRRTRPLASLALVAVAVVITSRTYDGIPVVQVAAVALASEAVGQYGRGRSLTAVLVLGVAAA